MQRNNNTRGAVNRRLLALIILIVTIITISIVLTACEEANITVNYVMGEETVTKIYKVVEKSSIIEFPATEKVGYDFVGWYLDEDFTQECKEIGDLTEITVYAKYSTKHFAVKFVDYEGNAILVDGKEKQYVEYGQAAVAPSEIPAKEGYEFISWKSSFNKITKDLVVEASYAKKSFSIQMENGSNSQEFIFEDSIADYLAQAQKLISVPDGAKFYGWYIDAERTVPLNSDTMIAQDVTLYPGYKLSIPSGAKNIVVDGTAMNSPVATVTYGKFNSIKLFSGANLQSQDGYSFEWICDGATFNNSNFTQAEISNLSAGEHNITCRITCSNIENLVVNSANYTFKITVDYGDLVLTPQLNTVIYNNAQAQISLGGLLKTDTLIYLIDGQESDTPIEMINVGEYTQKVRVYRDNYTPAEYDCQVKITPRTLTIKANDYTATYGDRINIADLGYTCDGLADGDIFSDCIIGEAQYDSTYAFGAKCDITDNNSDISVSGFSADNYSITYVKGKLTVNKATLIVTIDDKVVFYCDDAPEYTLVFDEFVNSEDIEEAKNWTLKCDYKKGDEAGKTYPITMSENFISDKYNFECKKDGVLTVKPKSVETLQVNVCWEVPVIIYNGSDQSSKVTAYYNDDSGNRQPVNVTFDREFINAGNYTATASIAEGNYSADNYEIHNKTKNIAIYKGEYTNEQLASAVPTLEGITYSPTGKLSDISLPNGLSWENPTINPKPTETKYLATYNIDPGNYYDATIEITLTVAKMKLSINKNLVEYDFTNSLVNISNDIKWIADGIAVNADFSVESFDKAGTYKTTASLTHDCYQADSVTVYVKLKGVLLGSNYYTIEDAFNIATSGIITVKYDTQFTGDSEIRNALYNNDSYYTLKSGVTLLVPYDDAGTAKVDVVSETDSTPIGAFRTLSVNRGVNLNINGTVTVNAVRGKYSTNHQGHTIGYYGAMSLAEGVVLTLNSGAVLNCNGYIIGEGSINALSGSKVYDVLAIRDFRGGKVSNGIYKKYFPFSQYAFDNIEVLLKVNYGGELFGRYSIFTSVADVNDSTALISSNSSLFTLSSGYVTKKLNTDTGKSILTINGVMSTNNITVEAGGTLIKINMSTKGLEFAVPGNFAFKIESGSTVNINNKFKLLPGSEFIIDEGATVNVMSGGNMYFFGNGVEYSNGVYNGSINNPPYGNTVTTLASRNKVVSYLLTDNTKFSVNGTLNVNSGAALGGLISSDRQGAVINLQGTLNGTIKGNLNITKVSTLSVDYTLDDIQIIAKGDTGSGVVELSTGVYTSNASGQWIRG